MFIVTAHATFANGKIYEAPANTLVETLVDKHENFFYIRHSIDGKLKSTAYQYKDGLLLKETVLFCISHPAPLRYIAEIASTVLHLIRTSKGKNDCYIGLDPLNAFSGIILKKLGFVKKAVFYTADYSRKRFVNKILNKIYLAVDSFCVNNADEVWNVSSRIVAVRKEMGLDDNKNIFVPNMPSGIYKKFTNNQKNHFHLVSLGIVSEQMDYQNLFDAVSDLKQNYPEILVKIIGTGPKEEEYKKYIADKKLQNHVIFMGHLNHERALEEISKSGIGLALYNGKWDFNYYGDSMKCREYFCYGLPVITTNTHSTVEEIGESKAGIVCNPDKDAYIKAIKAILLDYNPYSQNSYSLTKKYEGVHEKLIKKLLC